MRKTTFHSFTLFMILLLPFLGCSNRDSEQVQAYNRALEETERQQQVVNDQQKIVEQQLRIQGENIERFSKLIDTWEKQADRYDTILDKLEEKSGID